MDQIALLEQLFAGTVGGVVVLAIVAWKSWARMERQDARMEAKDVHITKLTKDFTDAVNKLGEAFHENSRAVSDLRDAIKHGERR